MPEIVLEQKINILSAQNIIMRSKDLLNDNFNLLNNFTYTFERFLKEDNFDLAIEARANNLKNDQKWIPALNINNNEKAMYNYSYPEFAQQMQIFNDEQFQVNRYALDQEEINDLNMSMVGMDLVEDDLSINSLRSIVNWNVSPLVANIVSDFDHIVHLKIPHQIQVNTDIKSIKVQTNLQNNYYIRSEPGFYELKIKYLNIFIKANRPDWNNPAQTLADIYAYSEVGTKNEFLQDFAYQSNGLLKSTAVKSGLKTSFNYDYQPNKKYQVNSFQQANFVGSISALESVYYDYKKQNIVKGISPTSIFNDMIPYNFIGNYYWNLNLKLNKSLDSLDLNFATNIKKPLLHPTNGKAKLKIKENNYATFTPNKTLTSDDLKLIQNNPDINLEGINYLAET